MQKFKTYVLQAPRWFGIPFFGASLLIGAQLAGGINANAWIALVAALLIMGGGHVLNTWGDWITGLDQGEVEDRSAEKGYTGGSNLIAKGKLSLRETFILGMVYYLLALIPVIYLAMKSSWLIIPLAIAGMCITFWYSLISKFTWTHELALGVGVGPLPLLIGMLAVNPHPNYVAGLLVSVPFAIVLSFMGLALDEAPDWEANVKKGVHSVAYEVSRLGVSLEWYCSSWMFLLLIYQIFLIQIAVLKPMTGLAFFPAFALIPTMVFLKSNFKKTMLVVVALGALYCILLLVGQRC